MRYGMRKDFGSKLPLYATLVAIPMVPLGLALIFGWEGLSLVFIGAFLAAFALTIEYMYRRLNYVVLHPSHFDVSRWTWGAGGEASDRVKQSVPYAAVVNIHVSPDGLIRLDVHHGPSRDHGVETVPIEFWPDD